MLFLPVLWKNGSETLKGDLGATERGAVGGREERERERERGREGGRERDEIEKSASSVTLSAEQNCIPESGAFLPSLPPSL